MSMNPPTLHGTMVDEDSKGFKNEVFKEVFATRVTPREKEELASNKIKDVGQVWFAQWRDRRSVRACLVDWGVFKMTFLDRFFPRELREKNLVEFMNLHER